MIKKRNYILLYFICALFLPNAFSMNVVDLKLQMQSDKISGLIDGGYRIGEGKVFFHGEHSGFRVYVNSQQTGNKPNEYLLMGNAKKENRIRIKLEKEGWTPDTNNGNGIIILTKDSNASFDILIDGTQNVQADRYDVNISASVIFN